MKIDLFQMSQMSLVKNKKILLYTYILFHISLLAIIIWKTQPWITGDSNRFLALADSFGSSEGFGLKSGEIFEPEGWRMPGYPFFIFFAKLIGNNSNFGIILLQTVLYIASIWLVWKITTKIFGYPTNIIFLLLSSIYPFVMYSIGQISPEIPTVFLLSLAVFLLLKPSNPRIIAAAFLIGLSAYFRPNLLLLNGVLFFSFLLFNYRNWRKPALVLITAFLVAAPYTIRNYLTFGKLTPLPVITGTGNPLMIAAWSSKISTNSIVKYGMHGEITDELKQSGMLEQISEINERVGVPKETIFVTPESYPTNELKLKANELLIDGAYHNIYNNPLGFIKVVSINSVRMWFSSTFPENYPWWFRTILLLEGIIIALLGLIGLVIALKNRNKENNFIIIFLFGLLSYFIVTLSWSHTEARYTISVRLFVLMFASYAIYKLLRFSKYRILKRD